MQESMNTGEQECRGAGDQAGKTKVEQDSRSAGEQESTQAV